LSDDDMQDYAAAAVRTGASRWAAEPGPALPAPLAVQVRAGEPGQSCVLLTDAAHGVLAPLLRRCTYATVWPASLRVAPDARTAVLAVQPLEAWTELWVMRASAQGWTLDALPPAASVPDLGYVEFAGWVPGAAKMLLAREARVDGRMRRSFEVLALDTLEVDRQAATPQGLNAFSRWQDSAWKAQTLILR
jgi:hypothetical protein